MECCVAHCGFYRLFLFDDNKIKMARKPGKQLKENPAGCTEEVRRWNREGSIEVKTGTVLEMSLEVRWPSWGWLSLGYERGCLYFFYTRLFREYKKMWLGLEPTCLNKALQSQCIVTHFHAVFRWYKLFQKMCYFTRITMQGLNGLASYRNFSYLFIIATGFEEGEPAFPHATTIFLDQRMIYIYDIHSDVPYNLQYQNLIVIY